MLSVRYIAWYLYSLFIKKRQCSNTNTLPLQNILGNVGGNICFVKCVNQVTGKMHTQKFWNSDVYTIVPRQIPQPLAFQLRPGK